VHQDARIYDSSAEQLRQVLADCPASSKRLMLVGHNPGLESLLLWLSGDDLPLPEDGKLMPTATLAWLRMPQDWRQLGQGCASLIELVRPRELPEKFPFPGPGCTEFRDRPAYYYNQSAVIPYRWQQGELEILVITASSKQHWVVPKGIQEPGMTPWDSAAKEALEEAGAEGEVSRQALGSYKHKKWGATCTVSVYPMAVKQLVPDEDWNQEYRQRRWLPAREAAVFLKQRDLGQMVLALEQQLTS
jgi:phosphohistidine phosphatase